jgi:lipopolysaccharide/colanic/teichoic acid biosynthesis glycosyltransferase
MRRLLDILFSATVLLLTSPLLVLVALAVKLDSRGPALYGGHRVGQGGRIFRMWKFRTMVTGADRSGSITGNNDARVTRIGRLLRKAKLDELPQFLNVLTGDMTLVGPRPEAPDIVALYTPAQRAVLSVKPGVTGRVQLESGDESESIPLHASPREYYVQYLLDGKVRRDLEYLRSRSPLSDALIVLRTATLMFRHFVRS